MTNEMKAGRELDALIAERVMGLLRESWPHVCRVLNHLMDEEIWCYDCGMAVSEAERIPPRFSSSVEEAWQVVKKLNQAGWLVSVKAMPPGVPFVLGESKLMSRAVAELHWVGWMQKDRPEDERDYMRHDLFASADTAPLAICRAALKALAAAVPQPEHPTR